MRLGKKHIISIILFGLIIFTWFLLNWIYVEPFFAVYGVVLISSVYVAFLWYGVKVNKAVLKGWSLAFVFILFILTMSALDIIQLALWDYFLPYVGALSVLYVIYQYLYELDAEVESYMSLRQYYFGNAEKLNELEKSLTKLQTLWYKLVYKR